MVVVVVVVFFPTLPPATVFARGFDVLAVVPDDAAVVLVLGFCFVLGPKSAVVTEEEKDLRGAL